MDKRQKLIKLIQNSNLTDGDKREWEMLVDASPDGFIEGFLEVFTEYPNEIGWFNDTYKRKREAFALMKTNKAKAQSLLDGIYKEEGDKLANILKSAS